MAHFFNILVCFPQKFIPSAIFILKTLTCLNPSPLYMKLRRLLWRIYTLTQKFAFFYNRRTEVYQRFLCLLMNLIIENRKQIKITNRIDKTEDKLRTFVDQKKSYFKSNCTIKTIKKRFFTLNIFERNMINFSMINTSSLFWLRGFSSSWRYFNWFSKNMKQNDGQFYFLQNTYVHNHYDASRMVYFMIFLAKIYLLCAYLAHYGKSDMQRYIVLSSPK